MRVNGVIVSMFSDGKVQKIEYMYLRNSQFNIEVVQTLYKPTIVTNHLVKYRLVLKLFITFFMLFDIMRYDSTTT